MNLPKDLSLPVLDLTNMGSDLKDKETDGLTNQLPVQQPVRKSKRKYMAQTQAEQLVILAQCATNLQSVLFDIMKAGKFRYPAAGHSPLDDASKLNGERLQLALTDVCSVLKLMIESGTVERAALKKLQKARLSLMLQLSQYQGQASPHRLNELTKKLI